MASNDEDDAVVGEESVAPRRTRSGRPVATARRGRGRKKTSSPRASRATRNTRAKQQMDEEDEEEEEEVLEGNFADCDTTEPGSAHGSSGEQEQGSPAQREEATSSSDGGGDKIQYLMEEDYSRTTPEATDDIELVSTNGMIDNEAEAIGLCDENSQGVPSSPEAEEIVPVDNGFEEEEDEVEEQKFVDDSNSYENVEISNSQEEVPELEASPPPSVTGSVTSTIQSNLRQRSIEPLEEDSQSQETLAGLNQLKEAVEELNGLVQPGVMEVEELAPAIVVSEVMPAMIDEPMETDREAEMKEDTRETQMDMDTIKEELEPRIDTTTKEPEVKIEQSSTEEGQTVEPDTEMVSEDELPSESKEPLETEAVSDEELPDPAGPATENLPETEEVSEDELPPEKSYKKKSKTKQKSQDKTVTGSESANSSKKKKKSRESQKRKMLVGDSYDPSSPTSENSMDAPPAAKKAAMASEGEETSKSSLSKAQAQQRKTLPELEKYWKAVKEDPSDFTGWTYLLQYVDQENDIDAAREAYDSFLSHYPYCYGYWRKYADYEKRKANKDKCEEVFQRGLKAIPLSVDLWIHYLNYCKSINADNEDLLREQFEKAIEACGLEFRSDRLWESYIKWEAEGKRLQRVTAIYDRLLATPTQSYISHFESFTALVNTHPPQKLLSVDEFLTERREVLQQLKQYEQPKPVVDPAGPPGEDGDAPPGEEGEEKALIQRNDEETTALREKIIANRRKIHKATVAAVSDRWVFEEAIKRPYFHVKPLERCQLKNWREYLDYEVAQEDRGRIIVLFERCLIACALYEDLWLKFIRYLENLNEDGLSEKIRDVYERACTIHHTKKPSLHLYWAVFEETHQNYDKASEILVSLEKIVPNMLQVAYRRINLERRRGQLDQVCTLYDHYIDTAKNKLIANNMAVKYARFCLKVKNDMNMAISILNKAIDKDKENPRLHLQLLDTNLQRSPVDETEVIASIDKFLENADADVDQKVMFAQRKVEFLEDFGSSVQSVQTAQDEFTRYCKLAKEKKKKMSDDAKGESKKSKATPAASGDALSAPAPTSASPVPAAAPPQYPPSQYPAGYSGAPAPPYQGQYPPTGQQPPYQYNQQYNQSDPNYANYQNWGYSQTGYGGYNQGWTGNYNYY